MMRDQLVDKCYLEDLQRKFLRETGLTLENALSITCAIEVSNPNAAQMETLPSAPVNSQPLRSDCPKNCKPPRKAHNRSNDNTLRRNLSTSVCFCCWNEGQKGKHPPCPANGATCFHCGKRATFSLLATENVQLNLNNTIAVIAQLLLLRKESLKKKSGLYGIGTLNLCDTGAAL